MNYDSDLYPTISPEDEATYMSDYDDSHFDFDADWREEDYDDSLDWEDDEDAFTSAGMGVDESYYPEDAFLDSLYEEQSECEMDFGCDW